MVEASGTAPESCLAFAPLQRYNIFILLHQSRNVNKLFRFPNGKHTVGDRCPTNKVHWNDCRKEQSDHTDSDEYTAIPRCAFLNPIFNPLHASILPIVDIPLLMSGIFIYTRKGGRAQLS